MHMQPMPWPVCQGNATIITGYCPAVQDAHIQRHSILCGMLAEEAKRLGCGVFSEGNLMKNNNNFFRPDWAVVKGSQAKAVDVTVPYQSRSSSSGDAVAERVQKYQHLEEEVKEGTRTEEAESLGFPISTRGKW